MIHDVVILMYEFQILEVHNISWGEFKGKTCRLKLTATSAKERTRMQYWQNGNKVLNHNGYLSRRSLTIKNIQGFISNYARQ